MLRQRPAARRGEGDADLVRPTFGTSAVHFASIASPTRFRWVERDKLRQATAFQ